jgi:hypothetical protein
MSTSRFRLRLDWHMLENRKACVPGFEDSSGGHLQFKTGPYTLRVNGPESGHIDGTYTYHSADRAPPFDIEAWVDHIAKQIVEDLSSCDMRLLKVAVRDVLTQAKQHCDECHQDIRDQYKEKP